MATRDRYIQKVVRQGNSAHITLPRRLLFKLGVLFGEFLEITEVDDGVFQLRSAFNEGGRGVQSPGLIPPRPDEVPKP